MTTRGVFQLGVPLEKLEKRRVALPASSPERRSIRYRCMRVKNGNWNVDDGFKEVIEQQFDVDMTWDNYRNTWDISRVPPYEVVRL